MSTLVDQLNTYLRKGPTLGTGVYLARTAMVVGDVTLGDYSSVWYHAVLRGDINRIVVGARSNIQDNVVVHLADLFPCLIGDHVTIGHSAIVHACTVGDEVLVGMGSTLLDGCSIGSQSIVGAHSLIPQGMLVPPRSLVLGVPARVIRTLSSEECERNRALAEKYVENAKFCLAHGINVGAG
jgi:carbonic anhydrase/acetyltransferase-like protein (isoleucine patch superfamily)